MAFVSGVANGEVNQTAAVVGVSSLVGILLLQRFLPRIPAVLIAVVVRTFLFEPFSIPSGSMIPTLLVGDYLFVSKYSYGYSRYSFPFGPNLFSGRIWAKEPNRGDVVVFKLPRDNETDYIKRVIGLPGDEIQMVHGVLHINGEAVKKERVDDFVTLVAQLIGVIDQENRILRHQAQQEDEPEGRGEVLHRAAITDPQPFALR